MYALLTAPCLCCGRIFASNPMRVPSHRDANGIKQPICQDCFEKINQVRVEKGVPPFALLPGAYEACDEAELP
jgi:hypothetical protein